MKCLSSASVLSVDNLDAALDFYKNIIGCEDYFRFGDYAGLLLGGIELHLAGPGVELRKAKGQGFVYIFCEGVDELYERITKAGAKVIVPIEDQEYSMRDFVVEDPDGNYLTFGQMLKSE